MKLPPFFRLIRQTIVGVIVLQVLAAASATAAIDSLSHAYKTDSKLAPGSLVSLDAGGSNKVVPANIINGDRLLGVAVENSDSLLAADVGNDTIQVITAGPANVLVSTLAGDIRVGDRIAVSPFNGVGMKALSGERVIGQAQTAFKPGSRGGVRQTIRDRNGRTRTVWVGYVSVSVSVGSESAQQVNDWQRLAKSLTGHNVSTARVIASVIVAFVALVTIGTIIYAAIYGSIISVGRNPYAKYSILRVVRLVLGLAGVTAFLAGTAIYFLLR